MILSDWELAIYKSLVMSNRCISLLEDIENDVIQDWQVTMDDLILLMKDGCIETVKHGIFYRYMITLRGKKLLEFHRTINKFIE